jgi:HPt (histidine-containing phosphotransfer) domain-containing protein
MGGHDKVSEPPPNESISLLESVLGAEATREIVRLFLHDFPGSVRRIVAAGREDQIRIVHGIKSSALHMGASRLSEQMAALETRLGTPGELLAPGDLAPALADFGAVAPGLRKYAGN